MWIQAGGHWCQTSFCSTSRLFLMFAEILFKKNWLCDWNGHVLGQRGVVPLNEYTAPMKKNCRELQQYTSVILTLMQLVTASNDHLRFMALKMLWFRNIGMGATYLNEFNPNGRILPSTNMPDDTSLLGKISGSILLFIEKVVTWHGQQLLVFLLGAKNLNMMLPQSSILGFIKDNDTAFLSIKFGHHLM